MGELKADELSELLELEIQASPDGVEHVLRGTLAA
jgi:hypothetical protein